MRQKTQKPQVPSQNPSSQSSSEVADQKMTNKRDFSSALGGTFITDEGDYQVPLEKQESESESSESDQEEEKTKETNVFINNIKNEETEENRNNDINEINRNDDNNKNENENHKNESNNKNEDETTNEDKDNNEKSEEEQKKIENIETKKFQEEEEEISTSEAENSVTTTDESLGANIKEEFSNFSLLSAAPDTRDIEMAVSSFLNFGTMPIDSLREFVIRKINTQKVDALINSDYSEAKKLDAALNSLMQARNTSILDNIEMARLESIAKQQKMMYERLLETNQKYDDLIQKAKEKAGQKLTELYEYQNRETSVFKKKWQSPEYLMQFNHPSQELLNKREVEKKMALSRYYDEAKKAKFEADKLQRDEEERAQAIVENRMQTEFLRLKESQQFEVEKVHRIEEKTITELTLARNKEIAQIESALKQMEIKKSQNMQKKRITSIPTSLLLMRSDANQTHVLNSPRTKKRIEKFRESKKGTLQIRPISDDRFEKLEKLTAKKIETTKKRKSSLPPLA